MNEIKIFYSFESTTMNLQKGLLLTQSTPRQAVKSAKSLRGDSKTSNRNQKFLFKPRSSLKSLEKPPDSSRRPTDIFPKWLLERSDFKDCLLNSNELDIGKICSKPFKLRDSRENRELFEWCKSCSFFKTMSDFTCSEVCEKLSTIDFNAGEKLIIQGQEADKMYFILKGTVGIYTSKSTDCIDIVGSNNTIGETGLELDTVRNATVIAHEPVKALLLEKEDYNKIVTRQRHKQKYTIVSFLKQVNFFKKLLAAKLEMIAWNTMTVQYKDKQTVYTKGQIASSLYIVNEGEVTLDLYVTVTDKTRIPNYKNEYLIEKKTYQKVLRVCKPGQFFGEEEMLKGLKRKTRAVCSADTVLFVIKNTHVQDNINEKQIRELMEVNEPIPCVEDIRKDIRKSLKTDKIKSKAIHDATNLVLGSFDHKNFNEIKKKSNYKTLNTSNSKINKRLLIKKASIFEYR